MDIISLIGLGIVLFASTNIDDIFVLLGFFSDRRFRAREVVAGQFAGIFALVAVSVVGSLVSLVLAPAYVGLLGLLPVLIGLKKLWELRGHRDEADKDEAAPTLSGGGGAARMASVAAVTIANGGDNIGIYTPMFATRSSSEIGVVVAIFAAMTVVWLLVAHFLVNHRTLGAPIRRYGHVLVPFVLIGLGLLIMFEAGSFELLV